MRDLGIRLCEPVAVDMTISTNAPLYSISDTCITGIVVMPTYNERENLPSIVPAILAHGGLRLLIVDDRSSDGTAQIAEALGFQFPGRVDVLHRDPPRSSAGSIVDGFRRAVDSDADVVI